ncbi:MAG: hypothetical protein R6V12_09415, partial [Candidatus Hydrogenedentota bacterium]
PGFGISAQQELDAAKLTHDLWGGGIEDGHIKTLAAAKGLDDDILRRGRNDSTSSGIPENSPAAATSPANTKSTILVTLRIMSVRITNCSGFFHRNAAYAW